MYTCVSFRGVAVTYFVLLVLCAGSVFLCVVMPVGDVLRVALLGRVLLLIVDLVFRIETGYFVLPSVSVGHIAKFCTSSVTKSFHTRVNVFLKSALC